VGNSEGAHAHGELGTSVLVPTAANSAHGLTDTKEADMEWLVRTVQTNKQTNDASETAAEISLRQTNAPRGMACECVRAGQVLLANLEDGSAIKGGTQCAAPAGTGGKACVAGPLMQPPTSIVGAATLHPSHKIAPLCNAARPSLCLMMIASQRIHPLLWLALINRCSVAADRCCTAHSPTVST
jgi:hypothetical protein